MKFSKDGHKSTAVVLKEKDEQNTEVIKMEENTSDKAEGTISPLAEDDRLQKYISSKIGKVRNLYKVLGIAANSKLNAELSQKTLYYFNQFMNYLFSWRRSNGHKSLKNAEEENQVKNIVSNLVKYLKVALKNQNPKGINELRVYGYNNKKNGNKDNKEKNKNNDKIRISDIQIEYPENFIHEFVSLHIRGSLKKNVFIEEKDTDKYEVIIKEVTKKGAQTTIQGRYIYIPDVIEKLVAAVCQQKDSVKAVQEIPDNELYACLFAIAMEYTGVKKIKEVTKSIQSQDVKVQVFGEGENCSLKLSNANHKKKKYIFKFMTDFASTTKEGRDEMLMELSRLVVLYFGEVSAYEEIEKRKIPLWNYSFLNGMASDIPKVFNEKCNNLLDERRKLDRTKEAAKRKKDIDIEMKNILHQEIARRYCDGEKLFRKRRDEGIITDEVYMEKRFWLEQIEEDAERIFLKKNKQIKDIYLDTKWLCENVWKSQVAFLCSKFVDMGKAVYHFAMPDLHNIMDGENVKLGQVLPQFRQGITSFDYEKITAEEKLERNAIVYIAFAVNNFASAICPPSVYEGKGNVEDVLQMKPEELIKGKKVYENAGWHLMQYFGGMSQWQGTALGEGLVREKNGEMSDRNDLIASIHKALNLIRNVSFHYAASESEKPLTGDSCLVQIFEGERKGLSRIYRKRFYSNNVLMFYKVEDISKLMDYIYSDSDTVIDAQIPSFKNILSPKKMTEIIEKFVNGNPYSKIQKNTDTAQKFRASLYFVLKEIYYNKFLKEKDLKKKFIAILEEEQAAYQSGKITSRNSKYKNEKEALDSLLKRIEEYKRISPDMSFGSLCQAIMTDYNQQNSQQKVRTNKKDNLPEAKYEHFKMLLYKGILEIFIQYYKRKGEEAEFCYSFLRKPECKEMMSEEDFCNAWQMNLYGELSSDHYDAWMISWFIVAHFMLPTHLNHLKGEIKSYFSYIEGIELRRRQFAFNKRSADEKEESDSGDSALAESMRRKTEKEKKERYKKILEVLNLASEYCGQVSADWNDYYENEEAYAKNIEKYVCYYDSKTKVGIEEQLRTFCNEEAEGSPSGYVGIFYDGKKPILNRNIVRAKMYGTERLLTECLADDRITKEEIKKFYQLTKKKIEKNSSKKRSADDNSRNLEEIFKTGTCENIKEEAKRREYQQKKNRIELVDIRDYSDMINDLMSQLISWCYLRERDRMYFQLGYYYVRLYHGGDAIPADSKLRVLERMDEDTHNKKGIADGAVLYQLAAIYTYELPVYRLDEKGYAVISEKGKAGSQISQGVNAFYKEYSDVATYEAGLSLFESGIEEMEINHFRDYIDHFKYFARRDRSMLELYSTMFGQFFRNDIKLKKNVPVAFQNILARHFVVAALGMDIRHVQRTVKGKERTYEMPLLVFKRDLESEVTVHKFSGNSKEKLDYYNEDFLTRMRKILEYKK